MQINISGKNMRLTQVLKNYVNEKVHKLDRLLEDIEPVSVDVELHSSGKGKGQPRATVELTLKMPDHMVRCEEMASNMYEAIDLVQEKMERKLREFKERFIRRRKKTKKENITAFGHLDIRELNKKFKRMVKKRKKFEIGPPVYESEAINRMELLGHDFYIFIDKRSGLPSVVYRRKDGGYGVIIGK